MKLWCNTSANIMCSFKQCMLAFFVLSTVVSAQTPHAALAGVPAKNHSSALPDSSGWKIPENEVIQQLLADRLQGRTVGVVVGVLEPAGTRIVSFGKSGAADGRPLDGDTLFQIGSVTKVFTGLLLADMAVRGQVRLEDPAARLLPPGVKMPQRGRAITLIDLSKHWSGLPSMPTNFSLQGQPDPYAAYTEQQLYNFLNTFTPLREPGKQSYSNLGVALLGRLLARQSGLSYEALLTQRVLSPLALHSTAITVDTKLQQRLSPGHDRFLQPVETWNMLEMPASGSLRSTAKDLLRFVQFNLNDDSPLQEAMALQRTPGRTLGWGRSTLGGQAVYGHEGGKEGYRSAVVFNPATKTGVVVLMNTRSDESPMAIARHLLFSGSALPALAAVPKQPVTAQLGLKKLTEYEGRYRLESGAIVEIARRDNHLLVQIHGEGVVTYFASAADVFWSNTSEAELQFGRDSSGQLSLLTLINGPQRRISKRIR